jgi:hypothetical protein
LSSALFRRHVVAAAISGAALPQRMRSSAAHRIRRTTDDDEQRPGQSCHMSDARRAELQGLGRTGNIDRPITYEKMAHDAVKLVDHLRLSLER